MLSVKDFILETMDQVADAIAEFEDKRGEGDASIIPRFATGTSDPGVLISTNGLPVVMVDFDVAITEEAENATEVDGSVGLVRVLKASASSQENNTNSATSRMKVSLPLRLPDTDEHKQDREARGKLATKRAEAQKTRRQAYRQQRRHNPITAGTSFER